MNVPEPLGVAELTRQLKELVEANFPHVAVRGEVSGLMRAGSGHVYFTLKDEKAQIRGVMWRTRASRLRFDLEDGMDVIAAGPVEIYAARGSYQLICEELIPVGVGPLELAFRQLQEKLSREGLFDSERKRPLPRIPNRIAIVTSPTSAAVRDMLQVISRRWPAAPIVILPVRVQGEGAAKEIAAALGQIHRLLDVDLVITGRGGGSLEDLWAFNEEIVARAIAECPVPVVSAVGHEIDVTIADLVADRRALTPSEAGELAVPDRAEWRALLDRQSDRLMRGLRSTADRARTRLESVKNHRVFNRPEEIIRERTQHVDLLQERFTRGARELLRRQRSALDARAAELDALSPLGVLRRGYSVTTRCESGQVVRDASYVEVDATIETRLASGKLISRIEQVIKSEPEASAPGVES
ncbi:exodeoxyribonuclease VII large subunit [Stratiformator vulcanicus]|uniref:Exodeoxyribonuclease 7 large subunit n=1 Tax=Stratiformator vulcanicus TaxID=2527980 RepID=A0A517R3X3_9PLAN|nr:exodeoxyribonuclease VII large subunit [Stratiformator vulcanicus]QDT38571.1 Exodeoxyribonuclease 7 large subunit [Stratiformator vulcanicus]